MKVKMVEQFELLFDVQQCGRAKDHRMQLSIVALSLSRWRVLAPSFQSSKRNRENNFQKIRREQAPVDDESMEEIREFKTCQKGNRHHPNELEIVLNCFSLNKAGLKMFDCIAFSTQIIVIIDFEHWIPSFHFPLSFSYSNWTLNRSGQTNDATQTRQIYLISNLWWCCSFWTFLERKKWHLIIIWVQWIHQNVPDSRNSWDTPNFLLGSTHRRILCLWFSQRSPRKQSETISGHCFYSPAISTFSSSSSRLCNLSAFCVSVSRARRTTVDGDPKPGTRETPKKNEIKRWSL